jgi:hypothetical protein
MSLLLIVVASLILLVLVSFGVEALRRRPFTPKAHAENLTPDLTPGGVSKLNLRESCSPGSSQGRSNTWRNITSKRDRMSDFKIH